jgi:hypothetical protein
MSKNTPTISRQYLLRFDVVKTNQGNGYHPNTGVFMVPETGIYVFTWTIRVYGTYRHSTELVVITKSMGIVHLNAGGSWDDSVTGIVVVHANSGDDVFLRTLANANAGQIASDRGGRSSFAGWKLA